MNGEDRAIVAGLRLVWREIPFPDRAPAQHRKAEAGSADSEPAFGLWVLDDPDAMLDELTQEEFERTDERMPYFALVWASLRSG